MVDDQNVDGEAHGAHQHQQIAHSEGKLTLDAQKIQGRHGQCYGDPNGEGDLAAEEQAEQGHQHHIEGGEEACLTCLRTCGDTRLLEVGGHSQRRTAAETTDKEVAAGFFLLGRGQLHLVLLQLVEDEDNDQQHHHGDVGAGGVEGKGVDHIGAQILRHEGSTPNQRGEDGEEDLPHIVMFHSLSPFSFGGPLCHWNLLSVPFTRRTILPRWHQMTSSARIRHKMV